MKIISKYKDYYDYLQGIYGIDNYKVYQRSNLIRETDFEQNFDPNKIKEKQHFFYSFAINNILYILLKTPKGIFPLSEKNLNKYTNYNDWQIETILAKDRKPTTKNQLHRKPILVGKGHYLSDEDWYPDKDPLMKSFAFHKVLSAKELYIQVETFLGWIKDNPPIPNKQTNLEKLLSNGFDKKISFRHRKK